MPDTFADISQFLGRIQELTPQVQQKLQHALDQAGEHVLGKAKERTPYDLGNLQKSATSEPAKWTDAGNCVKVIGFNTNYAAIVHETWQSNIRGAAKSRGKGGKFVRASGNRNAQARQKFLEMALREEAEKVNAFLRKAVGL